MDSEQASIQFVITLPVMKLIPFLIGLFLFPASIAFGQIAQSGLSGYVLEQANREALIGATLVLSGKKDTLSILSMEDGSFLFENVPIGRYQLSVNYLGFVDYFNPEILLESGRLLELEINLSESAALLPITIVRGNLRETEGLAATSAQILTIEEVRRFPATFNDPARLALAYAGVSNANDQANELIIRGNSPAGVSWRIEGVEIVNPNHLSNAGNEFDRISDSGGGVNALSAQMLSSSQFLTGAFPVQYGNALSGVMDMNLRAGNRRRWEATTQLGLLGLDFALEGPLSKNKKSSYLINYRYSTIGLLDALGVPLSDESIGFQDIAMNFHFPLKKAGKLSLFAIGGKSSNVLEAEKDSSTWEFRRDRSNINYQSQLAVLGLTHQKNFNNSILKSTLVYSGSNNFRNESYLKNDYSIIDATQDSLIQSKIGLHSYFNYRHNKKLKLLVGLEVNYQNQFQNPVAIMPFGIGRAERKGWLVQPYLNVAYQIAPRIELNAGMRFGYSSFVKSGNAQPRMNINAQLSPKDKLSLSMGVQSRQTPFYISFHNNSNLSPIYADHAVLSHTHQFNSSNYLRSEVYFQNLTNVPNSENTNSLFSSLNVEEAFLTFENELTNTGEGRNVGLEITWQQYLQKEFYFLINGSLFNSEYKNGEGAWRDSRYNGKYIFNFSAGKEFSWQKKWQKTFGINIHMNTSGGQWYTPIDLAKSQQLGTAQYQEDLAFAEQYPAYLKVDLRFYLRTSKTKRSTSLSLDIQNVLNRKNFGYYFYDADRQSIEQKDQLGLIPILNWRIEF